MYETQLERDGFCRISGVYNSLEATAYADDLAATLCGSSDVATSMRTSRGAVYAARNLLDIWPQTSTVWKRRPICDLLSATLGHGFGLVRALFFDKPPGRSWSLGWHRDLSIAVKDNTISSAHFTHPTSKAGVSHVTASDEILDRMLTARIHLDDVSEENGPLLVIPGSHRSHETTAIDAVSVFAQAGDVLLMRPRLSHASANAHEGTQKHRRILHLEFAADSNLPDGYEWRDFIR